MLTILLIITGILLLGIVVLKLYYSTDEYGKTRIKFILEWLAVYVFITAIIAISIMMLIEIRT